MNTFNRMLESYGTDAYDICAGRHRRNHESDEAHEEIIPAKKTLHEKLMKYFWLYGEMTCQEISERSGIPYTTCSARLSELKRDGKLFKVGTRKTKSGCSAAVLTSTKPPG